VPGNPHRHRRAIADHPLVAATVAAGIAHRAQKVIDPAVHGRRLAPDGGDAIQHGAADKVNRQDAEAPRNAWIEEGRVTVSSHQGH